MKAVDIVGNVYGRLTVIGRDDVKNSDGSYRWRCRCTCGTIKTFAKANLDGKNRRPTTSCGCAAVEYSIAITTHGLTGSQEYSNWLAMMKRCNNENAACYSSYGGRGIKVCPEWKDFETFLRDVGPRPSADHSLGRIDNDGDYEPSNVEWQTSFQQSRNTSRNVFMKIGNNALCMKDWATLLSINYDTLKHRAPEDRVPYILRLHTEDEINKLYKEYYELRSSHCTT